MCDHQPEQITLAADAARKSPAPAEEFALQPDGLNWRWVKVIGGGEKLFTTKAVIL